jgi:hypothetical protein
MLKIIESLMSKNKLSETKYITITLKNIKKQSFEDTLNSIKSKGLFDNFNVIENKIYRKNNTFLIADDTVTTFYLNKQFSTTHSTTYKHFTIDLIDKVFTKVFSQNKDCDESYKQKILHIEYKNVSLYFKIKGDSEKNIIYDIEININNNIKSSELKCIFDLL